MKHMQGEYMTKTKFNKLNEDNKKSIEYQVNKYFLPSLDKDDIRQEILLHLWQKRHRFDQERGTWSNYINMTIKSFMTHKIEQSNSTKVKPNHMQSLDKTWTNSKNETISLLSILSSKEYTECLELKELFQFLIPKLSSVERETLLLYVKRYSAKQIAKKLEKDSKQVYNTLWRIKNKANKIYEHIYK